MWSAPHILINLSNEIRKVIENNVEDIIDKICEEDIETSDEEEEVLGDNCEVYELCDGTSYLINKTSYRAYTNTKNPKCIGYYAADGSITFVNKQ